ncbi:pyridoxamine 5'-phosphate oxidase family protein [Kordiimonas sp. SCSIO 12603]|uniref:pyridoxamine 5'-phosphate oxidase family protein n=1 Tax=Kordiimonas sp. SCSIO 12603 TaxID=2829596 RepID=UPI00210539F3|nr:pyridoxamine 5'-phosphate oxidase family protein [Kordiimonas sp. SCSIO 12603]UTW58207.1 pyridoxamine 5'-phosphate oxidase family protein [Kordiimonas sp. SCSIO 12603]
MADFFDHILDKHADFIAQQPMFFTATACSEGRINLSPKGMDSFRVLNANLVGYLDVTGSGNETSTHLKHDGRITIMFNSFTRNPLIYRIYGRGRVARVGSAEYQTYASEFPEIPGVRQIILIEVESVQTSCGYGVPEMEVKAERPTMVRWAESKGEEGVLAYQQEKNVVSIDGLDTGLND